MSILSSAMSILSKKDEYTQVKCASIHGETDQPTLRGTSRNHRTRGVGGGSGATGMMVTGRGGGGGGGGDCTIFTPVSYIQED